MARSLPPVLTSFTANRGASLEVRQLTGPTRMSDMGKEPPPAMIHTPFGLRDWFLSQDRQEEADAAVSHFHL